MEWQVVALIMLAVIFVLLLGGVWIAFGLGIAGVVGLLLINPHLLDALGSIAWNNINSFILTGVPLFLFMGEILVRSRTSEGLYQGLSRWLDRVPGGLLQSNIIACTIFAAVSGSSVATAATIGAIAIPEIEKRGYDMRITFGSLAAGGALGILIPPSIPMIIYGATVGQSIGRLFIAGILPGLILSVIFCCYIAARILVNPRLAPSKENRSTWKDRLLGLKDFIPISCLIVLVLGGIYSGLVTPTESAAIGALGAVILAIIYRSFNFHVLKESLRETVKINSMILFIVVGAQILSFALVSAEIPRSFTAFIVSLSVSKWVIYAAIGLMYLILGCFVDSISMMLLTLPTCYPVIVSLGFDPIWFGIILVIWLEVGLITPPVAMNLFVIHSIVRDRYPLSDVSIGSMPFVLCMVVAIAIFTVFPDIVLWLPSLMMK